MVDVTEGNFDVLVPRILQEVRTCSFLALDAEFTGLLADPAFRSSLFDTGQQRYQKLRINMNHFSMVQLGLAVFTGVADSNAYTVTSYNLYLRPHSCASRDPILSCQTSALEFLQKHNFDFNKWLYEGVSYMNSDEIEELRAELSSLFSGKKALHMPYAVEDQYRAVEKWMFAAEDGDTYTVEVLQDTHSQALLLAALHTSFPGLWVSLKDNQVVARKVSGDERTRLEADDPERSQLVESVVERSVGFTRLFHQLIRLKKPVVLHNCLLDLMLLYKQFHKRLPESYDVFKCDLLELFPFIYDTKFVAKEMKNEHRNVPVVSRVFHKTSLGDLAAALQGELSVLYLPKLLHVPSENKYTQEGAMLHEAGYDAMLTGFCFLSLSHLSAMLKLPLLEHHRPLSPREHLSTLRQHANKVCVQRSAIPYMWLGGRDPSGRHPPWLVVEGQGRAARVSPGLVSAALARYGQLDVQPLNNKAVLVAAMSWKSVSEILANLSSEGPLKAQVYSRLRHSALTRRVMWSGAVLSTGLGAWLAYRAFGRSSS